MTRRGGVSELVKQPQVHRGYESPLSFHWGSLPDTEPVDPPALRLYREVLRSLPEAFSIVVYVEDSVTRRAYRAWRDFSLWREGLFPLPEGEWRQRPVARSEESRPLTKVAASFHESYYSSTALAKTVGTEETPPVDYLWM